MDEERLVGHASVAMMSLFNLDGRIALVTGAGGGIGASIADALATAGARVMCVGRTHSTLQTTVERIAKSGGHAVASVMDLAVPGNPERAVAECDERLGGIDILVNAAGIQRRRSALEVTTDDWDAMLSTNLKAVFFASQEAARRMHARKQGGSIINITSLTAVIGLPLLAVHGAIKGAVSQMTKALAVEWAPIGIRVNAIGPGRIRTPMTEELFVDPSIRESFIRGIPLGRAGVPADISGAAVFLAGDASSYVTGQTVFVDGGWLAAGGSSLK